VPYILQNAVLSRNILIKRSGVYRETALAEASLAAGRTLSCEFYVYWTVHHLDSWVKRDQLDVTCFIISLFNVQHVSDVNTSILRSLRLIC